MTSKVTMSATDALQALHRCARENVLEDDDQGMEVEAERQIDAVILFEDFLLNNLDKLEDAFDTAEATSAILDEGRIPEVDHLQLAEMGDAPLNRAVALCYELAQQDQEYASPEINLAGAFWLKFGPQICADTASYDVTRVLDEAPSL